MKRYGKAKIVQLKTLARLSDTDKEELAKFQEFLQMGKLPLKEVAEKHGVAYLTDYLGFADDELTQIGVKPAIAV